MTTGTSEEHIYEEARKRVKAKRGFWGNLIFYAVVNIICFLVWALGDRGYPWFLWVLGPWGILIILPHYLRVFVFEGGKSERRAIEQEAERIRKEQG
ncbi:MAG TPA: 2TM domain-containing protein [Dehalococcoidia bacterium]|nr:2TM domain-containing protein [Dehalococcoidia bacterium]